MARLPSPLGAGMQIPVCHLVMLLPALLRKVTETHPTCLKSLLVISFKKIMPSCHMARRYTGSVCVWGEGGGQELGGRVLLPRLTLLQTH